MVPTSEFTGGRESFSRGHSNQTNMKINHNEANTETASSILAFLQGDDEVTSARRDAIISVHDGQLLFYNSACGTQSGEDVIIDRLEPDSMGDGWDDCTPEDVINWLEAYC